tara:strand:- start:319 stop:1479 length:1161 start_codon:yes stop_codon:yes gene_type:complete
MNLFEKNPKSTIALSIIFLIILIELLSLLLITYRDRPYQKYSDNNENIIQKFDAHTFYNYNPNITTSFKPWKGLNEMYKSEISWEFDRFGMVKTSQPINQNKNYENKKTVVIFGGSTVFGVGSSSLDQTIASHLQNILNEKDQNTLYTVMNAGVRGYIAYQEFIRYLNDVKYLNPDIIISLNGRNDIYLASKGYLADDFNTLYSETIETQINNFNNKNFFSDLKDIAQYSNFMKLLNRLLIKFNKTLSLKTDIKSQNFNKTNPSENLSLKMLSSLDNYIHIMNLFNHSVSLDKKDFFWVLQPTALVEKNLTKIEEERVYKNGLLDDYKRIINLSYKYINFESDLVYDASLLFKNSNETLYIDECHYNDVSNFLIAQYLANLVLDNK